MVTGDELDPGSVSFGHLIFFGHLVLHFSVSRSLFLAVWMSAGSRPPPQQWWRRLQLFVFILQLFSNEKLTQISLYVCSFFSSLSRSGGHKDARTGEEELSIAGGNERRFSSRTSSSIQHT